MSRQNQLRKSRNIMPNEEEIIDMEMKSMQVRAIVIKRKGHFVTIQYVLYAYLTFIFDVL